MTHVLEPSTATADAISAIGDSAQGGDYAMVSTIVIGLFTLISTLLALYLIGRGRTRDDHRDDE